MRAVSRVAYEYAVAKRSSVNLMATYLNVETGAWTDGTDQAPNPPVDSFYEYLWGGFALLGDQDLRNWYNMLIGAINNRMIDRVNGTEPSEDEEDQLEEARGIELESRLSCQCVPDGTQDVVVEIPSWNRNLVQE